MKKTLLSLTLFTLFFIFPAKINADDPCAGSCVSEDTCNGTIVDAGNCRSDLICCVYTPITPVAFDIKEAFYGAEDSPDSHAIGSLNTPYEFISSILPNIYVISGVLLLLYAVFGGFIIVTSAGNPDESGKGKQIITNAIMGFIIIFASYWIVQIIEIITGVQILSFTTN